MTDSGMQLALREIGAGIVMVRGIKTRRRIPRMYCMQCLNPVGPDARAIWDPTLEKPVIGAVIVCSQGCEELAIAGAEGLRGWSHMLLGEFLLSLLVGSGLLAPADLSDISRGIAEDLNIEMERPNDAEAN